MSQPPIPRKAISEASYAVHRPSSSGPSSSNQQQVEQPQQHYHDDPNQASDEETERPSTPPPYSGPSTPSLPLPTQSSFSSQPKHYPGLPRLNYSLYAPSHHGFSLSSDQTTITTHSAILSKSPTTLLPLIQSLCAIPPKPVIRITGKSPSGTLEFDIKLNCMNLIWTDDEKARLNYVKCIGPGEVGWRGESKMTTSPTVTGGLEPWVKLFCKDSGAIKQFILERSVINWDTTYLEGRLLSLIASTSYRGHVSVTFPITHSKVVVHSPDKYNRFISNVTKVFSGSKKYEIVKSVWPYADVERGESARRCVVQDEERWFSEWKSAIRYAAVGKRVGWVTSEDRLEELMEPREESAEKPEEWGGY